VTETHSDAPMWQVAQKSTRRPAGGVQCTVWGCCPFVTWHRCCTVQLLCIDRWLVSLSQAVTPSPCVS